MFRQIRWTLLAIGAVLIVTTGISIFRSPEHEVMYATRPPLVTCTRAGCIFIYTMEIGNTGRSPQENVRVRLADRIVGAAIVPPSVLNFGTVQRAVEVRREGDVREYNLGRVPPQQRIQITLTLRHESRDAVEPWDRILLGIEAAEGRTVRGDPAATLLARMLFAVFGALG